MTGVRNGPLARLVTSAPGLVTVGVVPAGMTWLVKTVHVYNGSPAAAETIVRIQSATDGVVAFLARYELASAEFDTWAGWTALGPGDQVVVYAAASTVHVWVSGAELPGDIPPRAKPR